MNESARRRPATIAIALGVALAMTVPLSAAAAQNTAVGVGDPYYPNAGNPGYDVQHYGLDIGYEPSTDVLTGRAVITATASTSLASFNLDLDGLTVASVSVDGKQAKFSRSGGELTITPKPKVKKGRSFTTIVTYSGVPVPLDDAGFLPTDDGALVIGEPRIASSWFPVNDHPSDKALYTIRITVPEGVEAISNGHLVSQIDQGGKSVWLWEMDAPMASYLATATIGQFDTTAYVDDGISYLDAIDPDLFTPPVSAHSGTSVAYADLSSNSYARLQRSIPVDPASPELSFWIDRDVEDSWDFAFVEVAPAGSDDWTTLPDTGGILTQDPGGATCPELLGQHSFLAHYLSDPGDGGVCDPTGSTGQWWAATGSSVGWQHWAFDLSAYAGEDVDVAITYLTDYTFEATGVAVDDIAGPGGAGTTSFEDDGDALDGWFVPGAPAGSPGNVIDWVAPSSGPASIGEMVSRSFAREPEIIGFLAESFGAYPFADAGGIVDDIESVGFSLENQTRPIYSKRAWRTQSDGDYTVVHELAHQWFGDSVALERWADIWLNEGFATYAEWLWNEHEDGPSPQGSFDFYYNDYWPEGDPFWDLVIGDPGTVDMFATPVYYRGAMTLQALRVTIGDDAFFELLPLWHAQHKNGNGTTAEFIALAEQVSGQQLDDLFEAWLYTSGRPDAPASGLRSFGVEQTPRLPLRAEHLSD